MIKEFREFAFKGSLLDLAIGLILGAAFGKVVASLVTDVLLPPLGLLLGRVDFANLYINLSDKSYATLAAARDAGAPVIAFGSFLNTLVNFLVVALVLFFILRPFNRAKAEEKADDDLTEKVHKAMEEQDKESAKQPSGAATE